MKTVNAHIGYDIVGDELQLLLAAIDDNVTITRGETPPPQTEVIIHGRPPASMRGGPAVRHLIIPWAGVPPVVRDLVRDELPHIQVHNLHHNAVPVAETVWTLLLAAAKLTIPFDHRLRQGDWRPRYTAGTTTRLLAGSTMLILGYGAIGREVARRAAAFDVRVVATRRTPASTGDPLAAVHHPDDLPDLLPQADILCICLPLTPQTEGLIGAAELALLPPQAILINVGRGEIVQEKPLFHALQDGRLHAAGLDVWYSYPPDEAARANTAPAGMPFHVLENVVMSPHRGGMTDGTAALRMMHLAQLLNAVARGEEMPNQVDLTRGY